MAFKAAEFQALDTSGANGPAPAAGPLHQTRRYTLMAALLIVRQMETTATRGAVYDEIKAKNRIYRLVDAVYEKAGSRILQPLALFAYMLKCLISLGPLDLAGAEAVSIATFPNERKTVDRVAGLVPHIGLLRISAARSHMLRIGNLFAMARVLAASPRMWRFLQVLAARYSFMPAARIASALAYYIRFSRLLQQRPGLKAAIVTSNYSPDSVGLAAAAHKLGRRVVYANHAPVPVNGAYVPPVLADCGLFYGMKTVQSYQQHSHCEADVALIGQPVASRNMQWRDSVETVGIFLTAGTRVDVLKSLVATIRLSLPAARILIRQHPVALLRTSFGALDLQDPNLTLTIGNPLDEEIAACDLVICGNSGVTLNVLSAGRPVAYLSSLDSIAFDFNGFVASRLAYAMPWWSDDVYERLKSFYQTPGWREVMRNYDAAYDADIAALRHEAGTILERHIRPALPRSTPQERDGIDGPDTAAAPARNRRFAA